VQYCNTVFSSINRHRRGLGRVGSVSFRLVSVVLTPLRLVSACAAGTNLEAPVSEEPVDQGATSEPVAPPVVGFDYYHWDFEPLLSPDGNTLIVFHVEEKEVNTPGGFQIRPVATGVTLADVGATNRQTTLDVPAGGALSGVHLTTDGAWAFLPGVNPYQAHIVDLVNKVFTETIEVLPGTVYSSDGSWMLGYDLIRASDGSSVPTPVLRSVWDPTQFQEFSDLNSSTFAFSKDNSRFVIAGRNTLTREVGVYSANPEMTNDATWVATQSSAAALSPLTIAALSPSGNVVFVHDDANGVHTFSLINRSVSSEKPVFEFQLDTTRQGFSQDEIDTFNTLYDAVSREVTFSPDESFFAVGDSRAVFSALSGQQAPPLDPDYASSVAIQGEVVTSPHLNKAFLVDFLGGELRELLWETQTLGPPETIQQVPDSLLRSKIVQEDRILLLSLDAPPENGQANTVRVVAVSLPAGLVRSG
jgi:hypothetical protein